ncbi:MAG TPA: hypothetical protein VFB79_06145 [Candidatus Angelobacter sp.]|nr:hypothetical protein [Candidatus Angelobacter sp.]
MQYFLPSRKTLSALYQAPNVQLPEGGSPLHESFSFNPLGVMDVQDQTRVFNSDSVIWGLAGSFNGAGVFVQITHFHGSKTRDFFSSFRPLDSVAGNGQKPFLLPAPYAVAAGDSIQVIVKSLDKVNNQVVEVVLYANEVQPAS